MKKFDVEFKKLTDNKYPFVRFVRAEYSVSGNNLILHFLVSTPISGMRFYDLVEELREKLCKQVEIGRAHV